MTYNPWPIGHIPKHLQRPEPDIIKELGYQWNDPRDIIGMFEEKVAAFAGSKYAVATDCCTHAMELALRYLLHTGEIKPGNIITIPSHTYVSAAIMPMQLGLEVRFENIEWTGIYQLGDTRVWDGAVRWKKGMYIGNGALQCLSFQIKKRISIGRGGMILCDKKEEYDWLKLASYDGRDLNMPYTDPAHVKFPGYHYYLTPEDAARGIILMDNIKEEGDTGDYTSYPDVKAMLHL